MNRLIVVFAILVLGAACAPMDGQSFPVRYTYEKDADCPNFISFEARDVKAGDECSWTFSDEPGKSYSGTSLVHYFPKAGSYEVTLHVRRDGKEGTHALKVGVASDSRYEKAGEHLLWADEFLGKSLDLKKWNYDLGTGQWGNNELENYTNAPANSHLEDGKLIITAIKEDDREAVGSYTSARLTTQGKVEFHRGRVEVRAKMPSGKGTWAAIWMFGRHAAPSYSELDILEYVGCDKNIIYTTVHTTATLSEWVPKSTASKVVGDVETALHVYGMNWEDEKIEFYLDSPDNVYLTFGKPAQKGADYWPFDSDEYLILNLAVGGDWGGMRGIDNSIWPQSMEVDYVRVFQK